MRLCPETQEGLGRTDERALKEAEEFTSSQRLEKSVSGRRGRRGDRSGQPPLHPPITKPLLSSPGRDTCRPRGPAAPLPALRLAKSTMLPWDFSRSCFPWSLPGAQRPRKGSEPPKNTQQRSGKPRFGPRLPFLSTACFLKATQCGFRLEPAWGRRLVSVSIASCN